MVHFLALVVDSIALMEHSLAPMVHFLVFVVDYFIDMVHSVMVIYISIHIVCGNIHTNTYIYIFIYKHIYMYIYIYMCVLPTCK